MNVLPPSVASMVSTTKCRRLVLSIGPTGQQMKSLLPWPGFEAPQSGQLEWTDSWTKKVHQVCWKLRWKVVQMAPNDVPHNRETMSMNDVWFQNRIGKRSCAPQWLSMPAQWLNSETRTFSTSMLRFEDGHMLWITPNLRVREMLWPPQTWESQGAMGRGTISLTKAWRGKGWTAVLGRGLEWAIASMACPEQVHSHSMQKKSRDQHPFVQPKGQFTYNEWKSWKDKTIRDAFLQSATNVALQCHRWRRELTTGKRYQAAEQGTLGWGNWLKHA